MKLKLTILTGMLLTSLASFTQGIQFSEGTWNDVLAKAKEQGKPIFLDAYTTWCGPCKRMDKEVFSQPSVGEFFNGTFINYKMDMEKGEGISFAKKYEVNAFPTLLYFSESGELLMKQIGAKDVDGLLTQAKAALDPESQFRTFREEYENSDKSLGKLWTYANLLIDAGNFKSASELVEERLHNLTDEEHYSKEEWQLISRFIYDYQSPFFEKVLKEREKYNQVVEKEAVDNYIFRTLTNIRFVLLHGDDQRAARDRRITNDHTSKRLSIYDSVLNEYRKYLPDADYFIARMGHFAFVEADPETSYKYTKAYLDHDFVLKYEADKISYFLMMMAKKFMDSEGEMFNSAVAWAERSIQLDRNDYKNKYIMAQILSRRGKYEEALTLAEIARELRKMSPESPWLVALFPPADMDAFIEEMKENVRN